MSVSDHIDRKWYVPNHPGIEGNYSEIVDSLDCAARQRNFTGADSIYANSHGEHTINVDDEYVKLNVGLFSVCRDYINPDGDVPKGSAFIFDQKLIDEYLAEWDEVLKVLRTEREAAEDNYDRRIFSAIPYHTYTDPNGIRHVVQSEIVHDLGEWL